MIASRRASSARPSGTWARVRNSASVCSSEGSTITTVARCRRRRGRSATARRAAPRTRDGALERLGRRHLAQAFVGDDRHAEARRQRAEDLVVRRQLGFDEERPTAAGASPLCRAQPAPDPWRPARPRRRGSSPGPCAEALCYCVTLAGLLTASSQFLRRLRLRLRHRQSRQLLGQFAAFVLRRQRLRQVPARRRVARILRQRLANSDAACTRSPLSRQATPRSAMRAGRR